MCGLAGYVGIAEKHRLALVLGLGEGADDRGGHAAGYVGIEGQYLRLRHRIGTWRDADADWLVTASETTTLLMHARWATCGNKNDVRQAHPFQIKRNGKTVLYGAHNGMLWGAEESAYENGRKFTVDSREMFELLADKNYAGIESFDGYGVAMWVRPDEYHTVNLVRLSEESEIVAVKAAGGVVWASTEKILVEALAAARVDEESIEPLDLSQIGKVYEITAHGANLSLYKQGFRVQDMMTAFTSPANFPSCFDLDESEWTEKDHAEYHKWMQG